MVLAERSLHLHMRQPDHRGDVFATKDAVLDVVQRFEGMVGRRLTRSRFVTDHRG
jgi:hypothetical protein